MSYNGSGTFNINTAGQPVVTGTVITSTAFNLLTADLASGLTTALTKDGQTTPTANIPMGTFKLTGLGAGTALTDAAQFGQLQTGATQIAIVTGTDTLAGTLTPTPTVYATGNLYSFAAANTNTGAATININSLGAKSITKLGTTALAAGDLVSGRIYLIEYDGTRFQLINPSAASVTSFSAGTTGFTPSTATTGAVTLAGTLGVASGGTGLTAGTSGGVLAYTASGTLASSGALTASALVIGGGAGAAPSTTTTGTGVVTALGVNTGTAGAFVVNGGALGTPSSGTLTSATGLPISTGVSGLGSNVATFLATPSSANLASAVTDETGSGALVFATSPTLVTPALGSPSSVGTMPAFTLGGTVSGGGNQINNVIIGASTPLAGSFTTLGATQSTGGSLSLTSTNTGATTGDLLGGIDFISLDGDRPAFGTQLGAYVRAIQSEVFGRTTDLVFGTNAVNAVVQERMRLDASGNLGLGVTSIGEGNLQITRTGINTGIPNVLINASFANGANTTGLTLGYRTDETTAVLAPRTATGNLAFYNYNGGWNETARFTNTGNLLVGTTSASVYNQNTVNGINLLPGTSSNVQIATDPAGSTGNACVLLNMRNTPINGAKYIRFFYNGVNDIGNISLNGTTGVLYNLTSDYRLKNNPQALTGAKDFVMALQPKKWQWWDGSGEGVGFIAHEFMEVAKYSGQGEKDAVDSDGKPIHQSIQPSSSEVMANIVALMQEQQAIIESLKAQLETN